MSLIQTPVNQQRHTNIAVVRSKTKPKFELACYKNKVIDFRNGIEKDLSKVLQVDQIFTKVSEGTVAKVQDLEKVFGTSDKTKIAIDILKSGEIQISEKERTLMYETMRKDIINYVVSQCLNPDSKKPYTAGLIEREMKNIHFAINLNKSTKVQALNAIKKLSKVIPIVRAKMRLKIVIDSGVVSKFKNWISEFEEKDECQIEKSVQDMNKTMFFVLIDPGLFRKFDENVTQFQGAIEVVDPCVQDIRDKSIEEYKLAKSPTNNTNNHSIEEEKPKGKTKKKKPKQSNTIRKEKEEDYEGTLEMNTLPSRSKKKSKKGASVEDLYQW